MEIMLKNVRTTVKRRAGYATVFSQGISAVLCLFYIYRSMPDMWPEKHHWKLHAADSRHQLSMGIPMALQFAITASGTMMRSRSRRTFNTAEKIRNISGVWLFPTARR